MFLRSMFVLFLSCLSVNTLGQSLTVSGTVTDEKGEPIIGASVLVIGTTNGSITNFDGIFTLNNVASNAQITISYIGMKSQTLSVNGKTSFKIVLKEDSEVLDEVVVVGYGTQKKVNLTGAVTMADGDVLEDRPIANVTQGLQGAIPNLNITFDGGSPNATAQINVRGTTSLNGGSALILVDGVETNDISLLNPQDIASISVLKDASSAAVYGARAAFGVVLITTKKGTKGEKVRVNYNNNFSWSSPSRLPEGINSSKWIHAINQASVNSGGNGDFSTELVEAIDRYNSDPVNNPSVFIDQTGKYTGIGQWAYAANTNWFEEFYKKSAFMQQHNASISGGTEKNSYYASIGYKGQDGLFAFGDDTYKRINMSFNFTSQLTNWLEITFRTKYNRNESDIPNTYDYMGSSPYHEVYRAFPFIPVYLPDGNFAAVAGSNFNYNIAGIMAQAGRDITSSDDFWYTGAFNITPIKGLSIKGDYTGNKFFKQQKKHQNILYQSQPDGTSIPQGSSNGVNNDKYNDTYQALNLWAEYKKTIKQHSFGVMAGYNQESKKITALKTKVSGLYDNNTPVSDLATTLQSIGEDATVWAVQGMFFRLNYDYLGRYLLEVNGRYDGSSRFPHNDKWAFFPSASIGYRFSEEAFFAPLKKVVNNAKLRASYGEIGNEAIGDYMFEALISQRENTSASGYIYWVDGNGANANRLTQYNMPKLVSKSLTWERIRTTDIGLDLGFLNNELTVGFDWYQRENRDMLAPAQVLPNSVGATAPYDNAGTLRTRGWELNLDWHHKFGEFNVYANFNLSDSKTKVTKWNNDTKLLSSYYSGKNYGDIWGFETDRYFEESDFTGQNADGSWNYKSGIASQSALERAPFHYGPGDIKFKDLDGSGAIDGGKGTADDHGDLKIIGNSLPRYEYGFHLGGNWKGIDLDLFFQGVGKRSDWTISSLNFPMMRGADLAIYDNQKSFNRVFYTDDWKTITGYDINQGNTYPRLYPGNEAKGTVSGIANGSNNYYPQSRYLTDMSYLRLKNVTVGYTLPKEWTRKAFIEKARIYFSGSNLFLLYKGSDLPVDPEISTGDGLTYGGWGRTTPITRTFSFGIQVTL